MVLNILLWPFIVTFLLILFPEIEICLQPPFQLNSSNKSHILKLINLLKFSLRYAMIWCFILVYLAKDSVQIITEYCWAAFSEIWNLLKMRIFVLAEFSRAFKPLKTFISLLKVFKTFILLLKVYKSIMIGTFLKEV